jgi:hypothetical protein
VIRSETMKVATGKEGDRREDPHRCAPDSGDRPEGVTILLWIRWTGSAPQVPDRAEESLHGRGMSHGSMQRNACRNEAREEDSVSSEAAFGSRQVEIFAPGHILRPAFSLSLISLWSSLPQPPRAGLLTEQGFPRNVRLLSVNCSQTSPTQATNRASNWPPFLVLLGLCCPIPGSS